MQTLEADFLIEVWDLLKENVAVSGRDEAAERLLKIFENYNLSAEDCEEVIGEDIDIDAAIKRLYLDEDEDEELELDFDEDNEYYD